MHTPAAMMYRIVQHELAHIEHDPQVDFDEWFEKSNTAAALQRIADQGGHGPSLQDIWTFAEDLAINEDLNARWRNND